DSTLTNGQGTFSATLNRAGTQTITATDTTTPSFTATLNLSVAAQSASQLVLATATPAPSAGTAFAVTVTAQDQFGNTDPSYSGTLHFTSSDASAGVVLPPDSTLT